VSFLLDTNICSEHVRRPSGLSHRFIQHSGRLYIPTIVLGEIYTWAYRRPDPRPLLRSLQRDLLGDVQPLAFDGDCAERFGVERGGLLRRGTAVSPVDMMIASVALVHDFTLVTHNTADFRHIPGLRLEDWLVP
jgi:tRNA(fMet)-specific endonuclease VapC